MDSPYAWLGALCGVVGAAVLGYPILRKGPSFWFQRRFLSHRLGGLSFLLCWTYCWYLWVTDVERLLQTNLVMVCCLLGYYQCASAIWEFRFLRKRADMGFFSDKVSTRVLILALGASAEDKRGLTACMDSLARSSKRGSFRGSLCWRTSSSSICSFLRTSCMCIATGFLLAR
eukprot:scaffold1355_cov268-Pinguiococcus_pyrenoidosus.AAC.16